MTTVEEKETAREIIRKTRSVCPVCGQWVDGAVVQQGSRVYLERICAEHGEHRLLLSVNAGMYADLERFYFHILGHDAARGRITRYWVLATAKCQAQCAYCSVGVQQPRYDEMTIDDFQKIFREFASLKLTLLGGEPTTHPLVFDFFRGAVEQGRPTELGTNGIRLADPDFCRRLCAAGVNWVRLSVDALTPVQTEFFDTGAQYDAKLRALENLEKQHVVTTLSPTIFRGVNENQLIAAVEYANAHPFIRDLSVNGFSWVGEGVGLPRDLMIMPDEMMDILHQRFSHGPREDLCTLQKWLWIGLRVMDIRICLNTQLMIFVRDPGGPRPITDFLDMAAMKRAVEWWKKLARAPRTLQIAAFLVVCVRSLNWRSRKLIVPLLRMFFSSIARRLRPFPSELISVVLNTNCSLPSADTAVMQQCMCDVLYSKDGALKKEMTSAFFIRGERERLAREGAA